MPVAARAGMRAGKLHGPGVRAALSGPSALALLPTGELAIGSGDEPSIVLAR